MNDCRWFWCDLCLCLCVFTHDYSKFRAAVIRLKVKITSRVYQVAFNLFLFPGETTTEAMPGSTFYIGLRLWPPPMSSFRLIAQYTYFQESSQLSVCIHSSNLSKPGESPVLHNLFADVCFKSPSILSFRTLVSFSLFSLGTSFVLHWFYIMLCPCSVQLLFLISISIPVPPAKFGPYY